MTPADGNVVALLTPPGPGAIAVIRLSGPGNAAFAAAHLSKAPRTKRCVHCDLRDGGEIIDDIVAVLTPVGHLDLNVHGGPWVVQTTLQVAVRAGYTIGEGGPLGDAVDEIERQMLTDLPAIKSRAVLRLLTAQPAAWHDMLARKDPAEMRRAIEDRSLERALAVPTVAIVGPPNVGKSTLANALFDREYSITADQPGTTRDWVGELADLDGVVVRLVDTPGVRVTDDAIEAAAIERAGGVVSSADCVVVAVDGSRAMTEPERSAFAKLSEVLPGQQLLRVLTKADRPAVNVNAGAIGVSALTGIGMTELKRAIRNAVGVSDIERPFARCWTGEQRYNLLARLEAAGTSIDRSGPYNQPAP